MIEISEPTPGRVVVEIGLEEAEQFAIILSSGCPHLQALTYFYPDLKPGEIKAELDRWMKSAKVRKAILKLQGGPWEGMSLQEKLEHSISKHYTELAFFLFNTNYNDLIGPDRAKADVCRGVIEAKLAGMAGKADAMTRFFEDLQLKLKGQNPLQQRGN